MLPCVSFYQLFLEVLVQQHLVVILFQVAQQLYDISSLGSSVIRDLCSQILPEKVSKKGKVASGCVRIACSSLMIASLMQVVNRLGVR